MQIPVTIPDLFFGLKEAVGFLKVNNETLVLELQEQDSLAGAIKSDIQSYTIKFENLDSVEYDKKLLGGHVVITGNSLEAMKDIPGVKRAELLLKIDNKHKKEAENFISHLRLQLSEYHLKQMDDEDTMG